MAKVSFGPLVSEARNKLGGAVFSRNHYGSFSRAHVIPPYVSTAYTVAVRTRMTQLSQQWSTALTDAQRAGWQQFSQNFMLTDVLGRPYARGGMQAYVQANARIRSVGGSDITDAPLDQAVSSPGVVTLEQSGLHLGNVIVDVQFNPAGFPTPGFTYTALSADSTMPPYTPIQNACDGDPSTWWISQFGVPHYIIIDTGALRGINGFSYLPRNDGSLFSRMAGYEFYVSMDGVTWGAAASVGTFTNTAGPQVVSFAPVLARYFKLVMPMGATDYGGTQYEGIAEISVSQATVDSDAVQVWATVPMNAGRKFTRGLYRLIQTFAPGTPGPYDVSAAYLARGFDVTHAGALGVMVKYIRPSNGAASGPNADRQLV